MWKAVDYQAEDYTIRNHDSEFLEDPWQLFSWRYITTSFNSSS